MKEVVVTFEDGHYAALVAAWAAAVPSGFEDRFSFEAFIRLSAQTGAVTLLKMVREHAEGKI